MPRQNGRFTHREKTFVKVMALTNDAAYAATKAGYAFPERNGPTIAAKPAIAEATREEIRRFLYEKAGAIGVGVLVELATSPKVADGVRRGAAGDLTKLSGIAITEADDGKELHEMTGQELDAARRKLARRTQAVDNALAEQAKIVIEHEADSVFG
jgi:hypothetical protein